MSTFRLHRHTATLAAGVMAVTAAGLFLHTAVSRHERERALHAAATQQPEGKEKREVQSARSGSRQTGKPQAAAGKTVGQQMQALLGTANRLDQTRALLTLMKDFSSDDFRLALESFNGAPGGENHRIWVTLLKEWIRLDPAATMAFILPQKSQIPDVIRMWADLDAPALGNWLKALPNSEEKALLLEKAIPIVMEKEPEWGLNMMSGLTGRSRASVLRGLCGQEAGAPLEAAIRWTDSLQDATERRDAILTLCSFPSPRHASLQFALLLRNPDVLPEVNLTSLFSNWPDAELETAEAAIEKLPAGELHTAALQGAVPAMLASTRPGLAWTLMERHPDEVDDALLAAAARSVRRPSEGLPFAARIQDPYLRDKSYAETLDRWIDGWGDGEAQKWMAEHPVSDSVRQKMKPTPSAAPVRDGAAAGGYEVYGPGTGSAPS